MLTTKHSKSVVIGPAFQELLVAAVVEYPLETDTLSTFSRKIERNGNALECARQKFGLGTDLLGAEYGIAGEGSLGPNPSISFIPCGQESLYFIDRNRNFHLHLFRLCNNTNYQMDVVDSLEALKRFAVETQLPSRALDLRPSQWKLGEAIYIGIDAPENLEHTFRLSQRDSPDGLVCGEPAGDTAPILPCVG